MLYYVKYIRYPEEFTKKFGHFTTAKAHALAIASDKMVPEMFNHDGKDIYCPEGGLYIVFTYKYNGNKLGLSGFVGRLYILMTASIARTMLEYGLEDIYVGWPNDVYMRARKLALTYILPEDSGEYVAINAIMALNLNSSIDSYPYTMRHLLTTVKYETKGYIDPWKFTKDLVSEINRLYDMGYSSVKIYWLDLWREHGKNISVYINPQICVNGYAKGIGGGGEIVIHVKDGKYGIERRHRISPMNFYRVY